MQVLTDASFADGRIPDGWIEELRAISFEKTGLRTGNAAMFRIPVPGEAWRCLRVEVEFEPRQGALIDLSDGQVTMTADVGRGRHMIGIYSRGVLAETACPPRRDATLLKVTFDLGPDTLRLAVDDQDLVQARPPQATPPGGVLELGFWADCLVRRIRILAADPVSLPWEPAVTGDFLLEVTVDFADDLLYAPWTDRMLDQLFAEFKSWGVAKCQWIDYGLFQEGWWGSAAGPAGRNARQTFENVGEIFPAAVRAAHAHGVELHSLFKPFDMGLYFTHGDGTLQAGRGKLRRIGGTVYWISDFAAQQREFIMSRKPGAWGTASTGAYTRLDLVKEDDAPSGLTPEDVILYVSEDNVTYRPYEGPMIREEVVEDYPVWEHTSAGGRAMGVTRRARVFRWKELDLRTPYFALFTKNRQESFANTLLNLVHVFGADEEERLLTFGLKARQVHFEPTEGATTQSPAPDFLSNGVEFDVFPGTPTAIYPGYDAIRSLHAFDSGEGFLALARGKEKGTVATLSPSYPEVRDWWLSWLRATLEAGADGVELRVRNHHSPFAWEEFGFEQPVRDKFLRRYGIDLWNTDDFDKELLRRLRGEDYTEFYRQAKALVTTYGKKLGLHLSPTLNLQPELGAAMGLHWDWQTWIDEGLADSITLKEVGPGSRAARDILPRTRKHGLPVTYSPYANHLWARPGGEQVCGEWIRLAKQYGYDGYQLYESAAVLRGTQDGRLVMRQPALRELFRSLFLPSS